MYCCDAVIFIMHVASGNSTLKSFNGVLHVLLRRDVVGNKWVVVHNTIYPGHFNASFVHLRQHIVRQQLCHISPKLWIIWHHGYRLYLAAVIQAWLTTVLSVSIIKAWKTTHLKAYTTSLSLLTKKNTLSLSTVQ